MRVATRVGMTAALIAAIVSVGVSAGSPVGAEHGASTDPLAAINHIVVIYEENHSFDNLFGGWEGVDGLRRAASSGHVTQRAADGSVLPCLPQNDVNLTSPTPLPVTCTDRGVFAGFLARPSTPGQPPNRLSKLWFSS
jgi:phospholipase C